jgi:hypothetical protein
MGKVGVSAGHKTPQNCLAAASQIPGHPSRYWPRSCSLAIKVCGNEAVKTDSHQVGNKRPWVCYVPNYLPDISARKWLIPKAKVYTYRYPSSGSAPITEAA